MTERDDTTDTDTTRTDSPGAPHDDSPSGSDPGSNGVVDFDGNDRGWVWFLVLAVPVVAFLVSYIEMTREFLDRASSPAGIRIGIISQLLGTDGIIAIVFGGLTFLVVLSLAYRFSAGKVSRPTELQPTWGANTFRLLILGVAVIMVVTFMYAGTSLANTDQMSAHDAMQRYNAQDRLNMTVVASQWVWRDHVEGVNYTYDDPAYIPANTLISVRITSADVDHSFAIEQLGVKKDAIPGQVTHTWLYVKKPGTYQVNCAELCGAGHSGMTQKLIVMPKQKYIQWAHSKGYRVPFADNKTNSTNTNSTSGNATSDLTAPAPEVTANV